MRKVVLIVLCLCTLQITGQTISIPKDRALEKKIERTLRSMSLEEKIGQMIQLSLQSSGNIQKSDNFHFSLYKDKAKEIFGKYKIGSLLNTPTSEGTNISCTPEEWKSIVWKTNIK